MRYAVKNTTFRKIALKGSDLRMVTIDPRSKKVVDLVEMDSDLIEKRAQAGIFILPVDEGYEDPAEEDTTTDNASGDEGNDKLAAHPKKPAGQPQKAKAPAKPAPAPKPPVTEPEKAPSKEDKEAVKEESKEAPAGAAPWQVGLGK